MDLSPQVKNAESPMPGDQLAQGQVNSFAFGLYSSQSLDLGHHSVIDLDVRSHTHDGTPTRVYPKMIGRLQRA